MMFIQVSIPSRLFAVLLATVTALAAASAPLAAQTRSLSWTETTQLEIPGSLGAMIRLFGGSDPVVARNTLHLQGSALIQESDQTTFVTDLEAGRWISADHEARTYTTATFQQMAELSREVAEGVYSSARTETASVGSQASREELDRSMEEARAEIQFNVSAESTGERQRIGDHDATRHFVVTEFQATAMPEGVEERQGGTMYFLAELWQTTDVPAEEVIYEEWAQALASDPAMREATSEMIGSAEESGEAMAAGLAAWDPAVAAGLAQMAEAMAEIEGTTVRSVVTVAVVPMGVEPNRDELLAWEPASMGGQLRSAAADAARDAAVDAARGAIRGITGGLFGGRSREPEPEPEPEVEPAQVQPLFRMTTTRDDLAYVESNEDVLGTVNAQIADYREITLEEISTPQ